MRYSKILLATIACLVGIIISIQVFAKPLVSAKEQKKYLIVVPDNSPNFCASFKKATIKGCHYHLRFVPFLWPFFCHSVKSIHKEMLHHFHNSLTTACVSVDKQFAHLCMNQWQCYMRGGHDAAGHLCNGNGESCLEITALKKRRRR